MRLHEQRIDDVIDDKVAAVRLYPSQTEVLLAMDDRLLRMLGGSAGYVERSWSFPPVEPSCTRLRWLAPGPPHQLPLSPGDVAIERTDSLGALRVRRRAPGCRLNVGVTRAMARGSCRTRANGQASRRPA